MILRQILRLSSLFHSAVSVHLRRNIGLSAIVFNKTKELDPVQKLFLDKIREYNTKSKQAGGPVDAGPDFQKDMNESLARLQRAYGEGDLTKFPEFKFEEPKFEETPKWSLQLVRRTAVYSHGVAEHGTSCNLINVVLQFDFSGVKKLLTAWWAYLAVIINSYMTGGAE